MDPAPCDVGVWVFPSIGHHEVGHVNILPALIGSHSGGESKAVHSFNETAAQQKHCFL